MNTAAPVVRRAGPADANDLVPVVREFYILDRHEFDEDRVRGGLGPLLIDDTVGQVWVVAGDRSGALIGYAVVTWGWSLESGGRDALFDEIYLRTRGVGVGRVLLGQGAGRGCPGRCEPDLSGDRGQ